LRTDQAQGPWHVAFLFDAELAPGSFGMSIHIPLDNSYARLPAQFYANANLMPLVTA